MVSLQRKHKQAGYSYSMFILRRSKDSTQEINMFDPSRACELGAGTFLLAFRRERSLNYVLFQHSV
jgi:hypothetical protein